jgi:hypothetical protein
MKMKLKTNILLITSLVVVTTLSTITSCDDGPTPTKVEKATKLLTQNGGTWSPSSASITMDGIDVTTEFFDGFTMTFTEEGTVTTTGTSPMWLREDTWSFKDATASVFVRGQDDAEITIVELTKSSFVFTMEWDQTTYEEDDGGRKRSLPGTYEFKLSK